MLSVSDAVKWAEAAAKLPLWLFGGVFLVGIVVLYAPPIPGLDLAAARTWPWTGFVTLLSGVLTALLALDRLIRRIAAKPPTEPRSALTYTPSKSRAESFWSQTVQTDGSTISGMCAKFNAHNTSNNALKVLDARVVSPRLSPDAVRQTMVTVFDPSTGYDSKDNLIYQQDSARVSVAVYANGNVGTKGKRLPVIFEITEETGARQRVKAELWPVPGG